MKAQHAILRFAKYKGPTISRIEAHNERTKEFYASNPDIKTELSKYNFHLVRPKGKYRAEADRLIRENGCKARKDSVRMVETLVTASPEFFAGKKPGEVREFFEHALEFLKTKQDEETIVSAVVHVDEKTPHMHLCFVPITADGRLSAKEIVGHKKKLAQWQDEYWKHMVKKYPDFERGESASITGRTHIPPRIFKQAIRLNKQREQLEKLISELTVFNAAKKMPEIKALMVKMLPTAEMLHTYMNRAKATEKERKAEIAALEKAVAAGKVSVLEQLELRQQVQKLSALEQTLLDMQRTMDAIPPEIIASYKVESQRKETVHREER